MSNHCIDWRICVYEVAKKEKIQNSNPFLIDKRTQEQSIKLTQNKTNNNYFS